MRFSANHCDFRPNRKVALLVVDRSCFPGRASPLKQDQFEVRYGLTTLIVAEDWAVLSEPQRSQPWLPPPLQMALEWGAVGSAHATASAARTAPRTAMYLVALRT